MPHPNKERQTMRPIMTRDELARHTVTEHGRDYSKSDDGWSDMEVAREDGWHAVAGWGRDGWDLGDWPYVVISVRNRKPTSTRCTECGTIRSADTGGHEMRQTVEGDTTVYRFASTEDRNAAIDYLFIWYGIGKEYDEWAANGLGAEFNETSGHYTRREALDAGTLRVPERFRGPFSWARLDAEEAAR